jgi:hypothetical protein
VGTLVVWTGETNLALFGSAVYAFGLYAWVNTSPVPLAGLNIP